MTHWKKRWDDFCLEIIEEYGPLIANEPPESKTEASSVVDRVLLPAS